MKPKYIISFVGLFEKGYVILSFTKKQGTIITPFTKEMSTKFRFKFIADLWCKFFNWMSEKNYDLRTFKVVEL